MEKCTVGFFPPFRVGSVLVRLVGRPLTEFGFDFPVISKALPMLDVNSANGFLLLVGKPKVVITPLCRDCNDVVNSS